MIFQGCVRLLQYAEETRRLYFTTSLQNAVQTYSIESAKLLDPLHTHPSPPKVFALSANMELLLSASANPSAIYITNTTLGTTPVLLQPQCSSSTAVAAVFHPQRPSTFVLGFADGTLAVYDARYFFHNDGRGERKDRPEEPARDGEFACMKKMHTPVTVVSGKNEEWIPPFRGHESGTQSIIVGDIGIGISAVAFVPGFDCATISVGADGKCCIVDFTTAVPVVRSWHVMSAAISLSVIRPQATMPERTDKTTVDKKHRRSGDGYLVAIGCQDGRVLLHDLRGNLLGQRDMGADARIVGVDWLELTSSQRDGYKRPPQTNLPKPFSSSARRGATTSLRPGSPKISALDNTMTKNPTQASAKSPRHTYTSLRSAIDTARAFADALDVEMGSSILQGEDQIAKSPSFDGPQQSEKLAEKKRNDSDDPKPDFDRVVSHRHKTILSTATTKSTNPPEIPQRPTPKVGGRLAMRHVELGRISGNTQDAKAISKARSKCPGSAPGNRETIASTTHVEHFDSSNVTNSETPASIVLSDACSMKPPAIPRRHRKSKERSPHGKGLDILPAQLKRPPRKRSVSGRTSQCNSTTTDSSAAALAKRSIHYNSSITPGFGFPVPAPTKPVTDIQSLASNDTIVDWQPAACLYSSFNVLEDETASPQKFTPCSPVPSKRLSTRAVLEQASINSRLEPSSPQSRFPISENEPIAQTLCKCEHMRGRVIEELAKLEKAIKEDIGTLRNDMTRAMTLQRDRFIELMDKGNDWGRRVEEENRLLRDEMARERRNRA